MDTADWPDEFRNNFFVGNVVTSRINRDKLEDHGSTRIAKEEPDFLKSADPWFRPVDLRLGPDGAIYMADFYNRIIGHYEVSLTHPGRDHELGRIWRIVYKDTAPAVPAPAKIVFASADVKQLKILSGHVKEGQFLTKFRKTFTKAEMTDDLLIVPAKLGQAEDHSEYEEILPTSPP